MALSADEARQVVAEILTDDMTSKLATECPNADYVKLQELLYTQGTVVVQTILALHLGEDQT